MSSGQGKNNIIGNSSNSRFHRFVHKAMATSFEIVIDHPDKKYAEQAASAAFDEVDRLEKDLSKFIENSDISRINNSGANQRVRIGIPTLECLKRCAEISEETKGAFDITAGGLVDCWYDVTKKERVPSKEELEFARERTGMHLLKIDEDAFTVEVTKSGVKVDLGGFGKGYAADQIGKLLMFWDICKVLICAGASSVLAMEAPEGEEGWVLTLSDPANRKNLLAIVRLRNRALSASGVEKGFHIIDPRSGKPVKDTLGAWSEAADAATADAFSTAFMAMSEKEIEAYCRKKKEICAMVLKEKKGGKRAVLKYGEWKSFEL